MVACVQAWNNHKLDTWHHLPMLCEYPVTSNCKKRARCYNARNTRFGCDATGGLMNENNSSVPPIIEARGLTRHYGHTLAVRGVDLVVYPGEIVGFLGPNGAGKTTTIKMLIGLLRPSAGTVHIGGFDLQRQPLQAKALLGYVPDQPYLPEKLTVREFLQFMAGLYQLDPAVVMQRGEELLRLFELTDRADELLGSYSHGMRQKAALAGALLHNPRALFLDEPTVGLDPRSARLIKVILHNIAQQGAAVFMSTHILEIAERLCNRVFIINEGSIIASGSLEELRAGRLDSLEDIFLALTGGPEAAVIANALR